MPASTSHLKKNGFVSSGGPAGGQPFEKVAKHVFGAYQVFLFCQICYLRWPMG
jgi:hypothetical protein